MLLTFILCLHDASSLSIWVKLLLCKTVVLNNIHIWYCKYIISNYCSITSVFWWLYKIDIDLMFLIMKMKVERLNNFIHGLISDFKSVSLFFILLPQEASTWNFPNVVSYLSISFSLLWVPQRLVPPCEQHSYLDWAAGPSLFSVSWLHPESREFKGWVQLTSLEQNIEA